MAAIRDIIKEATTRINLVPRRQAVPGDIMETAYRLLKGIVSKYNSDNLLSFTQNSLLVKNSEFTHIYDQDDFIKGKDNLYFDTVEAMNEYSLTEEDIDKWALVTGIDNVIYKVSETAPGVFMFLPNAIDDPLNPRLQQMRLYQKCNHVQVRDVAKINSIYLVTDVNEPYRIYSELTFVPANKFDNDTFNSGVYTVTEKSEGEWLIQIKPGVARLDRRLKINYNEAIDFDLDSDLYIPDNYVELLIVALAHKLALQYPRLDETQMNRLQMEVQTLVDNVRTPKSITRMIVRDDYYDFNKATMTRSELLGGPWF